MIEPEKKDLAINKWFGKGAIVIYFTVPSTFRYNGFDLYEKYKTSCVQLL